MGIGLMSENKTDRVIFTGRVQGVGFRYTVQSIAKRHPVKGYVKNLADGSVELVMQGAPAALNEFLAEIADHFRDDVTHCQRDVAEFAQEFRHFEIHF